MRQGIGSLLCVLLLLHGGLTWAGALERAMLGKSAVVDLTHVVSEHPAPENRGSDSPADADKGGVGLADRSTRLRLDGARGNGARTIAQIPSRELLVPAVVVSVIDQVSRAPEYRVTADDLRAWERKNGRIPRKAMVLVYTGWSKRWLDPARYANLDADGLVHGPGLSSDALAFLAEERLARGFGLDALIPQESATARAKHGLQTAALGIWQIENLIDLDRLPAKGAKLVIAPLRVEAPDAPVRVLAILP